MTVSFPIFRDAKGERFVFPGLYEDGEKSVSWGFCRHICAALDVTEEPDRLELEPEPDGNLSFPHVVATAGSSGFAHGSSDVWLIGGPTFDEISATHTPETEAQEVAA